MPKLTLKSMNETLSPMGVKVARRDGEYRVSYSGRADAEETAYYTADAEDALSTGRRMGAEAAPKAGKYRVTSGPSWAGYELWAGRTLVEFGSLDAIIAYLADRDLAAEDCALLNDLRRRRAVRAAETKHLFGLTSEEFHTQRF